MKNLLFNIVEVKELKGFKLFLKMNENDDEENLNNNSYITKELICYLNKSIVENSTIISNNVLYIAEFAKDNKVINEIALLVKEFESILQPLTCDPVAFDNTLVINDKLKVYYQINQYDDEELSENEISFRMEACPVDYTNEFDALQDWSDLMLLNLLSNYYFAEVMESSFQYSNKTLQYNEKTINLKKLH